MLILCLGKSYTGQYLSQNFAGVEIIWASRGADCIGLEKNGKYPQNSRLPDGILDTVPVVYKPDQIIQYPYRALVDSILERDSQIPLIHISSTSVLGQNELIPGSIEDSIVLTEKSSTKPVESRARQRLELEIYMRKNYPSSLILRAAGIYGPGRNLMFKMINKDFTKIRPDNRIVSRIHVHDLCQLIVNAISKSRNEDSKEKLIHAVDELPSSTDDVYKYIQDYLSLEIHGYHFGRPLIGRRIKSLYLKKYVKCLKFPDYKTGFLNALDDVE